MEAALNSLYGRTALGPAPLRLGRAPDNTLVISDQQSSSHHAEVKPGYGGDGYQITDLNSTNGTFVNEQRLSPSMPRPLNSGDVIRIGTTNFTYEVVSGYAPTVAVSPPSYEPTVAVAPPDVFAPSSQPGNFGAPVPPPYSPPPAYEQQSYPQQSGYPQQPPAYQQPGYPQQPPAYPQPGYPQQPGAFAQPGYPQQPGAFAQPIVQPQRRSNAGLIIGIVVILVVLLGGGAGVFAFVQSRPTPQRTLQTYCNDLKSGNYKDMYHLYSKNARGKTTEDEFVQSLTAGLKLLGGIKDCTVGKVVEISSTKAQGTITYTFNDETTKSDDGPLILEDGEWKLDDN